MSFIITIHAREGIVMASDSRLTLNTESNSVNGQRVLIATGMSDSSYKTFLTPNNIGISTFGQADINGSPISGYIETFIREHSSDIESVTDFANKLNNHFRSFSTVPDTGFHIAGYENINDTLKQIIYRVSPYHNIVKISNPDTPEGEPTQGASWDGEGDILARLLQPVFTKDNNDNFQALPHFQVPWNFFTLQDAIDFAVYAIRTTIDSVRFLPRAKTVGGPIDVLVIKPNKTFWISKKELSRN